jgi:SPP1 family predicted phage head-tail adaptor
MSLSAGKLRHRINIQSVTYTQDSETGEMVPTWANVHTNVYCAIEPLSVKDFMQSQAAQSEVAVRVTIRKIDSLTSAMRLVGACGCHLGKIYNPAGWLEDPESGQEYMTAPCAQGVNEG